MLLVIIFEETNDANDPDGIAYVMAGIIDEARLKRVYSRSGLTSEDQKCGTYYYTITKHGNSACVYREGHNPARMNARADRLVRQQIGEIEPLVRQLAEEAQNKALRAKFPNPPTLEEEAEDARVQQRTGSSPAPITPDSELAQQPDNASSGLLVESEVDRPSPAKSSTKGEP